MITRNNEENTNFLKAMVDGFIAHYPRKQSILLALTEILLKRINPNIGSNSVIYLKPLLAELRSNNIQKISVVTDIILKKMIEIYSVSENKTQLDGDFNSAFNGFQILMWAKIQIEKNSNLEIKLERVALNELSPEKLYILGIAIKLSGAKTANLWATSMGEWTRKQLLAMQEGFQCYNLFSVSLILNNNFFVKEKDHSFSLLQWDALTKLISSANGESLTFNNNGIQYLNDDSHCQEWGAFCKMVEKIKIRNLILASSSMCQMSESRFISLGTACKNGNVEVLNLNSNSLHMLKSPVGLAKMAENSGINLLILSENGLHSVSDEQWKEKWAPAWKDNNLPAIDLSNNEFETEWSSRNWKAWLSVWKNSKINTIFMQDSVLLREDNFTLKKIILSKLWKDSKGKIAKELDNAFKNNLQQKIADKAKKEIVETNLKVPQELIEQGKEEVELIGKYHWKYQGLFKVLPSKNSLTELQFYCHNQNKVKK